MYVARTSAIACPTTQYSLLPHQREAINSCAPLLRNSHTQEAPTKHTASLRETISFLKLFLWKLVSYTLSSEDVTSQDMTAITSVFPGMSDMLLKRTNLSS